MGIKYNLHVTEFDVATYANDGYGIQWIHKVPYIEHDMMLQPMQVMDTKL